MTILLTILLFRIENSRRLLHKTTCKWYVLRRPRTSKLLLVLEKILRKMKDREIVYRVFSASFFRTNVLCVLKPSKRVDFAKRIV